jgi:transcriptional regulator with XRE-family HTH domain
MTIDLELLGPRENEGEVFTIENLVFSVQIALQRAMNDKGMSNKKLAERLGMTPGRVSQIFSAKGPNLTLKTIGRVIHALGEDFEFVRVCDSEQNLPSGDAETFKSMIMNVNKSVWTERGANAPGNRILEMAA